MLQKAYLSLILLKTYFANNLSKTKLKENKRKSLHKITVGVKLMQLQMNLIVTRQL